MEPNTNEATAPKRLKTGGRKPLRIIGITLAVLLALATGAYAALCAYAVNRAEIWDHTVVLGQDVGGLTVEEAAQKLESVLPDLEIGIYLYADDQEAPPERAASPDASVALSDLNVEVDTAQLAREAYEHPLKGGSWLSAGWRFLTHRGVFYGSSSSISVDGEQAQEIAEELAQELSREPVDASYEVQEGGVLVQMPEDGRDISAQEIAQALTAPYWDVDLGADIPYTVLSAKTLTAQEIYDDCSGVVKNASYDKETDSIVPEEAGADFDVEEAQQLMDAAEPGETVTVPAQVELPAVTAEELEQVLFRDVLGEARTHVGGTSARRSNVKLSAAAINEYVMNSGDVFSYNEVVGQRTAARGYQAAPAYVQGQTVDEIGGGICQTSSTLYLACLRSNLEITERYAHRYVPAYITAGMDATVSWGGPDYKFTNNSLYPIKIVTKYENNYLTVQVLGTNVDGTSVKMTNEWLSTTPYETVYEDDPTLAPGTEKVKTTPYTGYKYRTYRNVYDADGKLISSTYEATSDYKSRNQVILRGPAVETAGGDAQLPDGATTTPTDPTTPTEPAEPQNPTVPAEPGEPDTSSGGQTQESGAGGEQTETGGESAGSGTAAAPDVLPQDEPFL